MDATSLLSIYDREQRRDVEYPRVRREVTPRVVRHVARSGRGSKVVYARLDPAEADRTIRDQIEYFEQIGHDFAWQVYAHDSPADLTARLIAMGFEPGAEEAVLVLDVNALPDALARPPSFDVRRIVDPAAVAAALAVQVRVFGDAAAGLAPRLAAVLRDSPASLSLYAAYDGATPVSAAWTSFHEKSSFAGLWGGATLAEHRGHGAYTALVAARAAEARARGVRYVTVDASPMSRPILEKLGFRLLSYTTPCTFRVTRRG